MIWIYVVAVIGALVGCSLLRVSKWNQHESIYWYNIAAQVRVDPALENYYRPLLMWTKENKPSFFGRLRKWENPRVRQIEAL